MFEKYAAKARGIETLLAAHSFNDLSQKRLFSHQR